MTQQRETGIYQWLKIKDFGARSRYLRQGLVIACQSILSDAITYSCLRCQILTPKSPIICKPCKTIIGKSRVLINNWLCKIHQSTRIEYINTPPKKVLGHLCLPLLRLLLWWFFSEALSISPRVLINEVSFVGKSISRIMNFNNFQWV